MFFFVFGFILVEITQWFAQFGQAKGPKYDGRYLKTLVNGLLGDLTLKQTLTNVVIPALDVKLIQPLIFTTSDAQINVLRSPRLADFCLPEPTFLPAHFFVTKDEEGKTSRTFDVVDGAIAANNPTMAAISHVIKEIKLDHMYNERIESTDTKRLLVLPLGTGLSKHEEKYNTAEVSKWGAFNWISPFNSTSIISVFMDVSSDMVDFHVSTLFHSCDVSQNYLCIQEDTLTWDASSVDIAIPENLQNLVKIGQQLLKKQVSRENFETGKFETVENEGTNEKAFIEFAKLLSKERKLRLR